MSLHQSKDGLKGQKTNSPGHRPEYSSGATSSPCKGKSSMIQMLMPLQGDIILNAHIPRAMPWAKSLKPLQGIKQHSLNSYAQEALG